MLKALLGRTFPYRDRAIRDRLTEQIGQEATGTRRIQMGAGWRFRLGWPLGARRGYLSGYEDP
jgi:hypothetical protein